MTSPRTVDAITVGDSSSRLADVPSCSNITNKRPSISWKGFARRMVTTHQYPATSRKRRESNASSILSVDAAATMLTAAYHQDFGVDDITTHLTEIWVDKIFPNWATKMTFEPKETNLIRSLVTLGVPCELRGEYWKKIIGNPLKLSPEYYRIVLIKLTTIRASLTALSTRYAAGIAASFAITSHLNAADNEGSPFPSNQCHQSRSLNESTDYKRLISDPVLDCCDQFCRRSTIDIVPNAPSQLTYSEPVSVEAKYRSANAGDLLSAARYEVELVRKSFEAISVDLHRTLPHNPLNDEHFRGRRDQEPISLSLIESLRSVLEAFVIYRPDIGYVQGMGYLAITLLFAMDEFSAFLCFANLVCRETLLSFYRFDIKSISLHCRTFDILLNGLFPKFAKRIEKSTFTTDIFLIEWWFTLFSRSLPNAIAYRVWDTYFIEGEAVLFQTALGIIHYFRGELESIPIDQAMLKLSSLNARDEALLSPALFFSGIEEMSLSNLKIQKALRMAEESFLGESNSEVVSLSLFANGRIREYQRSKQGNHALWLIKRARKFSRPFNQLHSTTECNTCICDLT